MIQGWIVKPLTVGDQDAEHRAELEQLMPVAVIAREPRRIEAQDQTGVAKSDLGDKPLEAATQPRFRAGLAQILINDGDPFSRPAQRQRTLDQPILQRGAFLMMPDLSRRRLADINISQLRAVERADRLVSRQASQHWRHSRPGCAASGKELAPVAPPVVDGSVPATLATGAAFSRQALAICSSSSPVSFPPRRDNVSTKRTTRKATAAETAREDFESGRG